MKALLQTILFFSFLAWTPLAGAPDFAEHIHYSTDTPNKIGYIKINDREGQISQSTWLYIKSAMEHFQKEKPIFIVLDLNTPGGEVFPAMKISDALHHLDTEYNIPVVTVINNWAISAGAMVAYSTRFITTVKDGAIGAAEPVTIKDDQMQSAPEKVNSALRVDFTNRAGFYGRNPLIAEKMVDKSSILVFRDNEILRLNLENEIRPTDVVISGKDKLLTLSAEQMMKYGVANMILEPTKVEAITPQELAAGEWPANKMLLFHQPFFKDIPNATIHEFQPDWKTQLFMLLAHPMVASALFLGLMMGAYMEMNTPGFGVAGSIAAICLSLIIISSFSQEIASYLEVFLMALGALILVLDFTLLPTFGILGFFGLLLFLGGLFAIMLPGLESMSYEVDTQTLNAAGEIALDRLTWYLATFVIGMAAMLLLARYITPSTKLLRRFVLSGGEQEASQGYTAGIAAFDAPEIGAVGEVISTLRPSGKAVFGEKLYDVVSEGAFIEKGTKVLVVRTENGNVIVKEK